MIQQRRLLILGIAAALPLCAAACCNRSDLVGAEGVVVSPPSLDFGEVEVGSALTKTLAVSNNGVAELHLTAASIAGSGGPFATVSFSPATVSPGSSATLSVSFAPLSEGPQSATLTLTTDAAGSPTIDVALSGTGVAPAAGVPDGGPPQNPAGCADGTREGFTDLQSYPAIAACSGAWSVPGLFGVPPACGNQGGNDGSHADGNGCAAADLCAAGWHVCLGSDEVQADANGSGCAAGLPSVGSGPGLFFAVAQHSCNNSVCDASGSSCSVGDNDNDVFGCAAPNSHLGFVPSSGEGCGVLDSVFASTSPNSCGWTQAMPPNGPWACQGSNSYDEGDYLTKDGCQGNSCCTSNNCYGNGAPLGPSDEGGVLCCRDS
ncbi:MAG: choice-of-anchor D domain-containing protein [Myxococcales bacterium]